jgi:aminopeptidase N
MMKQKIMIIAAICLLFFLSANGKTVETGVSATLAQERAMSLSDVRYKLHFDLPRNIGADVRGEESIRFIRKGTGPLVIDFKASAKQLKKVSVNGKQVPCLIKDEHITIPSKWLKYGENSVYVTFVAGNKPLNRRSDYLYTLFVPDKARSTFPCFDQPDIKARFSLSLRLPSEWQAVSDGALTDPVNEMPNKGETFKTMHFAETLPLPTYLFSFVAGKFEKKSETRNGRTVTAFYRETDTKKLSQLPTLFDEVFLSLSWLEKYTDIQCPFPKYDFVILPGFQFGGMEHPGAIQFTDKRMFVSEHPTPDEELRRMELIAHETTHLWFGDMVTMRWFDDVWTKEVFANYLAAKIVKEQFPKINHDLNFLKTYQMYALDEDRTRGTHPIKQQLSNLQDAGLLYGNIIYEKAPVMMRSLEQQTGTEAFRNGLRKYLRTFAYGNATWEDLIAILDAENPLAHLRTFSENWVKQKGMGDIHYEVRKIKTNEGESANSDVEQRTGGGHFALHITQCDPYRRGIFWQQRFEMGLVKNDSLRSVEVNLQDTALDVPIGEQPDHVLPNINGQGYGYFITDTASMNYELQNWYSLKSDLQRQALLMNIYEAYRRGCITPGRGCSALLKGLPEESNALVASTICRYLREMCFHTDGEQRSETERAMWAQSRNHKLPSCRQQLLRALTSLSTDVMVTDSLYELWKNRSETLLGESDYMEMAYQLALRFPERCHDIADMQRSRLQNADRQHEFDYIIRACSPSQSEQERIFRSLFKKENRAIEPWTAQLLALLNHPLREPFSNRYILPALGMMQEIQRTGDIFFPTNWVTSLLSGHRTSEARQLVDDFLDHHPNYPVLLKNKILQAADGMK